MQRSRPSWRIGWRISRDASVWGASEFQSDTGELKLQFLNASGADVDAALTTGEFGPNDGTWVEQTLGGSVPAGARRVRV